MALVTSAMGQKQTSAEPNRMSTLSPIADIRITRRHVCYGRVSDIAPYACAFGIGLNCPPRSNTVLASQAPAQKHVICGIRDAEVIARSLAWSLRNPTLRVDAPDGCGGGKDAVVAALHQFEFKPRNVA